MAASIYHNTIHDYSPLARHFADFLVRLNGTDSPELHLAALLLCEATSRGHICLKLDSASDHVDLSAYEKPLVLPDIASWKTALGNSKVVGRPGEFKPLIFEEENRLYTYRYWHYEENFVNRLLNMTRETCSIPSSFSPEACRELIARLFPDAFSEGPQSVFPIIAAFIALTRNFCLITGSPGTGKTTAVARILAFLLELTAQQELRIALSAPTAKAAVRLQEAIAKAKRFLPSPESVLETIPDQALTLHRLLGSKPDRTDYAYGKDNPLPFDIIVVDEASMIDLPLISHLLDALADKAKLILLGDPFQLSSVEAGAVLGDIRNTCVVNRYSQNFIDTLRDYTGIASLPVDPNCSGGIQDSMVMLTRNYRFHDESPLGHFRRAVINGNAADALTILSSGAEDLEWIGIADYHSLKLFLEIQLGKYLKSYLNAVRQYNDDVKDLFSLYEGFRVLCAVRGGLFGTVNLNQMIEKYLKEGLGIRPGNPLYPGKAVMVTRNDYSLQLFNGDIGIFLPDAPASNRMSVCFRDMAGGIRKISPYSLPEHETAFALTVHKSQGSEYDQVFLFLPEVDSPVLCRELLYTGITRARKILTVCSGKDTLAAAISRKIERHSGLTEKILGNAEERGR